MFPGIAVSEAVVSGGESTEFVDFRVVSWNSGDSVWNSGLLVLKWWPVNKSAEWNASALSHVGDLLGRLGAADSATEFVCDDALKLRPSFFLWDVGMRSAGAEKEWYFLGSCPLPMFAGIWSLFTEGEKSLMQRIWELLIRVFCSCSCRSTIFSGLLSLLLETTQVLAAGLPGHRADPWKLFGSWEDSLSVSGWWNVKFLCPLVVESGPSTENEGWNDGEITFRKQDYDTKTRKFYTFCLHIIHTIRKIGKKKNPHCLSLYAPFTCVQLAHLNCSQNIKHISAIKIIYAWIDTFVSLTCVAAKSSFRPGAAGACIAWTLACSSNGSDMISWVILLG